MTKEHILVVEDEEDIRELIAYNLEREGYRVTQVESGEEAISQALEAEPQLILLDLMLPGLSGLDVCRELRARPETADIPIVILSARGEESDVVTGLELGADDYMTKPFSPRELVARLRAVSRRGRHGVSDDREIVSIHDVRIDKARHEVSLGGKPLKLTLSEFLILELLARHPDRVFTRNRIIEALRGDDYPVTDRSVDVHMVGLRKKLGPAGRHIETVRGVGYRMKR
ncbi:MAG: response regulator transcription factor [Candidatus Eisenbacteria bacterium]|uniref:Response regulator transcription factor n=1 Tax=Eiseniibacteriota bacterium TaxID=2212470 RepID=A0A956M0F8_UNCEI|nr:response regulator transcription factor [Candidatus Eisenbacteria bacterium]